MLMSVPPTPKVMPYQSRSARGSKLIQILSSFQTSLKFLPPGRALKQSSQLFIRVTLCWMIQIAWSKIFLILSSLYSQYRFPAGEVNSPCPVPGTFIFGTDRSKPEFPFWLPVSQKSQHILHPHESLRRVH